MKILYTIQSCGRHKNISRMEEFFGKDVMWFVPTDEVKNYSEARNVIGVDGELPMKSKQLNAALDYGFSNGYDFVVTSDDDLQKCIQVYYNEENKKRGKVVENYLEIIESTCKILKHSKYYLAGYPTTSNPFFSNTGHKNYGMLSGGILIHKRLSSIKFDEDLKTSEDFDFILQNHKTYGGVVKHDEFLFCYEVEGRTKKLSGGYQGHRSLDNHKNSIEKMIEKHNSHPHIEVFYTDPGESNHNKVKWRKFKDN